MKMKSRIFLLLSLVFGFLQGPFLPPVFMEGLLLVFFLFYNQPRKFLPTIFLGGLIFDLLQGQTLGTTSLLFVLASSIFFILREQISLKNPVFLGVFVMVVNLIRAKIVFGILPLPSGLLAGFLTILIFKFFWHPRESEYKII